VCKAL